MLRCQDRIEIMETRPQVVHSKFCFCLKRLHSVPLTSACLQQLPLRLRLVSKGPDAVPRTHDTASIKTESTSWRQMAELETREKDFYDRPWRRA